MCSYLVMENTKEKSEMSKHLKTLIEKIMNC